MQLQFELFQQTKTDPYESVSAFLSTKQIDKKNVYEIVSILMADIEHLFGARVELSPYRFGGVYFSSTFPRLENHAREKKYVIRLARSSKNYSASVLWQLAHECVHLLSPAPVRSTLLDEGLACWYQTRWTKKCPALFPENYWAPEKRLAGRLKGYYEAYSMVDTILSEDQDAIKRVRQIQPVISKIKPPTLMRELPLLDLSIAKRLCSGFYR